MQIIYPPRPKLTVPPSELDRLEKSGRYIVQRKFNGHRNLIYRSESGRFVLANRYGRVHDQTKFRPPGRLIDELSSLKWGRGLDYWLDSELLHPRVPNTIVLFDVLQEGRYRPGFSQSDRLGILDSICQKPENRCRQGIALEVTPLIWLAQVWGQDFRMHFEESRGEQLVEGVVLRRKDGMISNPGSEPYEAPWMIRCRKPGKSYFC